MKYKKKIVLFTLIVMNIVDQPAPEVEIDQGILSGKISADGSFYEYLGIPYATTNKRNRFQAPLPPPSWNGVYKAVDEHFHCPQPMPFGVVGTEDCLKVNIYVPTHIKKSLPVMVYIHGGAFILGNGGKIMLGPDFLVTKDVIVITINYRLGVLGFACLGIKEAPGNAGLKDQIEALKWVQRNIAAFGGNPDNVTIFGCSAGAVSVSLLIASPATNGLFNKAIVQSGGALASWAFSYNDPLQVTIRLMKKMGYDTEHPIEIYNILKDMPYNDLIGASYEKYVGQLLVSKMLHLPCVEKSFPSVQPALDDLPYNLMTKHPKNVSIIYGYTDKEGLFIISEETDDTLKIANKRNIYDPDLEFKTEKEEKETGNKLRKFYFGNEDVTRNTIFNLSDVYSHLYFEIPMVLESEIKLNHTEALIYNYYFKYDGERNFLKYHNGFKNVSGASHGDDILYTFNGLIWPFKINERDRKIIENLTRMWTNFAKYGNPTPEPLGSLPIIWEPSTKDGLNFLYIDEEFKMGRLPNPEAFTMWKDIYEKHRRR